jgi:hypothetical protein
MPSEAWHNGTAGGKSLKMAKRLIIHVMLNLSVFLGADFYLHNGVNTRTLLADLGTHKMVSGVNSDVVSIRSAIHGGVFTVQKTVVRSSKGKPGSS